MRVRTREASGEPTPSEAVIWGKVDPDGLPDTDVACLDSTVAMSVIVSYAQGI
jgi:deoxyhypusine synthase